MLAELRIENFAIIDKLSVSFSKGLTVITGETGAGKSIIIDAIGLLIGGRGSSEYVRYGTDHAEIEALFDVPGAHIVQETLSEMGIDAADEMLVLRRTIYKNGKSVCRANGKLVTLSQIRSISQNLIDVHGQHEHQELMDSEWHIKLLDRFGGAELAALKKDYQNAYSEALSIHKEMQAFTRNEQELAQRYDLIRFQIEEIKAANVELEEEASLMDERRRYANFEKLFQALQSGYSALSDENRGLDSLRDALTDLEQVNGLDADLDQIYESMSNSFYLLEEQATLLRQHLEGLEFDPARLDLIESRLNDLNGLKRKYGRTLEDVLTYYTKIKEEFEQLEDHEVTIDHLHSSYQKKMADVSRTGDALAERRRQVASQLERAINRELKDLHMEKAAFKVGLELLETTDEISTYSKQGKEKVEFLITTNPGEPLKPLAKIASGGELSRIMLAIKSHFKSFRGTTSIIFDEVDTGVSGRVAQAMAEKIYELSVGSQVFCITHLPQVASMADTHLYISKAVSGDRTSTKVDQLKKEDQIAELARMISGAQMTDLTKQHAQELLELAYNQKH